LKEGLPCVPTYYRSGEEEVASSSRQVGIPRNDNKSANSELAEDAKKKINFIQMDAAKMGFREGVFDGVVNFLGLEDIYMTRGKEGVFETFQEVQRVLRPGGYFSLVVMPPEEMETEAQNLEVELFSYICQATWLHGEEYLKMLSDSGFKFLNQKAFRTGKKLTSEQAKEEIRFACEMVPRIYGVRTPSFDTVWARYGKQIERQGLGHYSKVVLFEGRKHNQHEKEQG
jgi:SAM-dependent methyltransferase